MKCWVVLLLGFILSCSSKSTTNETINGTTWTLVQYTDSAGTSSTVTYPHGKSGNGYWVAFEQDTIHGSDNCNHFGGTYKIEDDDITTANIISTLIGCPDNLEMIVALNMVKRFEFIESKLYLYTEYPKLTILVFERIG
jgi:heat shock protein HslJ